MVLIQEVNFDGDLCKVIYFRDITHSFNDRLNQGHSEFESVLQKKINSQLIMKVVNNQKSMRYLKENE